MSLEVLNSPIIMDERKTHACDHSTESSSGNVEVLGFSGSYLEGKMSTHCDHYSPSQKTDLCGAN